MTYGWEGGVGMRRGNCGEGWGGGKRQNDILITQTIAWKATASDTEPVQCISACSIGRTKTCLARLAFGGILNQFSLDKALMPRSTLIMPGFFRQIQRGTAKSTELFLHFAPRRWTAPTSDPRATPPIPRPDSPPLSTYPLSTECISRFGVESAVARSRLPPGTPAFWNRKRGGTGVG